MITNDLPELPMNLADLRTLALWRAETRDKIRSIMSEHIVRTPDATAQWVSWLQSLVAIGETHKHELYYQLASSIIREHEHTSSR